MSEVVERVARALYECPGDSRIAKTDYNPPGWDHLPEMFKDHWRIHARAAIEALHDSAGELSDALSDHDEERDGYLTHADAFRKALTAVLCD